MPLGCTVVAVTDPTRMPGIAPQATGAVLHLRDHPCLTPFKNSTSESIRTCTSLVRVASVRVAVATVRVAITRVLRGRLLDYQNLGGEQQTRDAGGVGDRAA